MIITGKTLTKIYENLYLSRHLRGENQKLWQEVVKKHIDINKTRIQYQFNLVTLSDYLSQGKKILSNYVDHFSKLATSVLTKKKTEEVVLKGLKKLIFIIWKLDIIQRDNEKSLIIK